MVVLVICQLVAIPFGICVLFADTLDLSRDAEGRPNPSFRFIRQAIHDTALLSLPIFALLAFRFVRLKYRAKTGDLAVRLRSGEGLPSLRAELAADIAQACVDGADELDGKLSTEAAEMRTGQLADAALGIAVAMGVEPFAMPPMDECIEAVRTEFDRAGTSVDRECMHYVLEERAGSSELVFFNTGLRRDCSADGEVLLERLTAEGRALRQRGEAAPAAQYGMRLNDFVVHDSSRKAQLHVAEVLVLRLYTTAAFQSLNNPLRTGCSRSNPHPFPVAMHLLVGAIKKLRSVEALTGAAATAECDLWRGMKNMRTAEDFRRHGGTERAPMSTSADLNVALKYSRSPSSLLLKIRTKSFMDRGADIAYLSAFPGENELVYPPLTYLRPTGQSMEEESEDGSVKVTVIEVEPSVG